MRTKTLESHVNLWHFYQAEIGQEPLSTLLLVITTLYCLQSRRDGLRHGGK